MYGSELLEDMDTSDDEPPEHSNLANDEDTEWVRTKERKRRQARKRNTKMDNHVETVDLEQSISMASIEGVCCSCSKVSLCKTSRCECRAASGICGLSCSCEPTRCSNREEAGNMFTGDVTEGTHDLASHGAMLLQTALSEKRANPNTDGAVRKPLSDIGNNLVSVIHMA